MKMKLKFSDKFIKSFLAFFKETFARADGAFMKGADVLFGGAGAPRVVWLFAALGIVFVYAGAQRVLSNRAQASISPDAHVAIAEMREDEITRKARGLRNIAVKNPERISNFSVHDLLIMLDRPDLMRAEGDARTWQFTSPLCVMDVFLTIDSEGREKIVHHELRPRRAASVSDLAKGDSAQGADVNMRACIDSLAQRRLAKGAPVVALPPSASSP